MVKLVYPKESYQVMGFLFDIQNELGTIYQEKHYQRALSIKLKKNNIPFKKEMPVNLFQDGELFGKFVADFVIYGKILIELKVKPRLSIDDNKQVLRYLRAMKIKLGILVNFYQNPLEYQRIINKIN